MVYGVEDCYSKRNVGCLSISRFDERVDGLGNGSFFRRFKLTRKFALQRVDHKESMVIKLSGVLDDAY